MLSDFLDKILDVLGMKKAAPAPRPQPRPRAAAKPKVKQVFEGRSAEPPAFTQGVVSSQLIEACLANITCEHTPHIEHQRIYSTVKRDMEGNLAIEYDGIAGSCGPTKNFGLQVAREEELLQAYRYVDLNHIYTCCCGNSVLCPFYRAARAEREMVEEKMLKLEEDEAQADESTP